MSYLKRDKRESHFKDEISKTFFIYAFIPIIVLTLVTYVSFYFIWSHIIKTQNLSYNRNISAKLNEAVSYYNEMAMEISRDDEIKQVVYDKKVTNTLYYKMYEIANKKNPRCHFLILDSALKPVMTNFYSLPSYFTDKLGSFRNMIRDLNENPDDVLIMTDHSIIPKNDLGVVMIGKAIELHDKIAGYVLFDISGSDIEKILGERALWNVVITDKYNHIAFTTNINFTDPIGKLNTKFIKRQGFIRTGDDSYFVIRNEIAGGVLYIYTFTAIDFLDTVFFVSGSFLILVFTALAVSMFFVARYIANKKTAVIDEIVEAIHNVQNGNLNRRLYINTNDEFKIIGDSFNQMLQDIKELIELNREEAKQSIISELKQLESQFNSHFLYNTLETLKYMVKFDGEAASKIIVKLSNLLRYSMNGSLSNVTLQEDISHTENYLFIQRIRFSSRFNYFVDIDERCRDCVVPKLITQPLIENAIQHNMDRCDQLSVNINAKLLEDKLVITVRDNGDGISAEELNAIKAMLSKTKNDTEHIGLYNVQRRIRLMYGEKYGLMIKSWKGKGTIVKIFLPFQKEGDIDV